MYPEKFVQYLTLPCLPQHLVDTVSLQRQDYEFGSGGYWTDQHNQLINAWCQQHICDTMYFAFQCFDQDVELHRDVGTQIKLNYVLSTGGSGVVTEFYDDDEITRLDHVIIQPHRWHLLKANVKHRVCNIESGQTRFAITARVF